MDTDVAMTFALVTAGSFLALLTAAFLYEWALQGYWRHKYTAWEWNRQREARDYEARQAKVEARLAAEGRDLLNNLSGPSYRHLKSTFAQLRGVRTGLARYGEICFRVLHSVASSYTEFPYAYRTADQDPYRRRAQLQVMAIAAAGLEAVGQTDKQGIFDPSLADWRTSLEQVRYVVCPNCPVVDAPERYPLGCPVMLMSRGGVKDDERRATTDRDAA